MGLAPHWSQSPISSLCLGLLVELVVGDDLARAARQGILEEARLQVNVANMDESEGITIKINGTVVNQCFDVYPTAGKILLENEKNEIFFRNIEIRPISTRNKTSQQGETDDQDDQRRHKQER